jgi:hypothetical protein
MYARNHQTAPKVDYPYQRQRHESGELVVPRVDTRTKLTQEQVKQIEEGLKKSLCED